MTPSNYQTFNGLLQATERTLRAQNSGAGRRDGMSIAMWLHNAREVARSKFHSDKEIICLIQKFSITRRQDLHGGDGAFGIELPKRDYGVGDNIPGVGSVQEVLNEQLLVAGQWFHRRCFN